MVAEINTKFPTCAKIGLRHYECFLKALMLTASYMRM
jgi:hypothetical protein